MRTPAGETPPTMPDYTTRGETAEGAIRNALWLCTLRIAATTKHERPNYEAIARLLENALVLGVPAPQEPTT